MNQAENIIGAIGGANIEKAAAVVGEFAAVVLKNEIQKNQAIVLMAGGALALMAVLAKQLQ